MTPAALRAALAGREPFHDGPLAGSPVIPHNSTPAWRRWAAGSAARVCSGAMFAAGFSGGVIGAGRGAALPLLGRLDPAPAMAMALGEARYIIWSYSTPVVWWLGPEVAGAGPDGEWVEVAARCNADYGRFSKTTSGHQRRVHAALRAIGAALPGPYPDTPGPLERPGVAVVCFST